MMSVCNSKSRYSPPPYTPLKSRNKANKKTKNKTREKTKQKEKQNTHEKKGKKFSVQA